MNIKITNIISTQRTGLSNQQLLWLCNSLYILVVTHVYSILYDYIIMMIIIKNEKKNGMTIINFISITTIIYYYYYYYYLLFIIIYYYY